MLSFIEYRQIVCEATRTRPGLLARNRDMLTALGAGGLAAATVAHHATKPAPDAAAAHTAQTQIDRSERNNAENFRERYGIGKQWSDMSTSQRLRRAHLYGDMVGRPLLYAGLITTAGFGTNAPSRRRPRRVDEANTPGREQYVLNRRAVRRARAAPQIAKIGTTIDPQQKDPVKVLSSELRLQSPDLQILMRPTLDPKLAAYRRERMIPQSAMLLDRTRGARSKPADPHPTRTRRPRQYKSSGIRPEPYG